MQRPATAFTARWQQTPSLLALRRVADMGAQVRRAVSRAAGLSETELRTLEHLVNEPLGPGEVARRLGVTTAAATGIVDRLVSHGHAERRAREDDRRRTDVEVTESGREEVLAHLLPMFTRLAALDASFTEEERAVVTRYLDGAAEAFRSVAEAPTKGVSRSDGP